MSKPFWTPEYLDFIRPLRPEDVLGEAGGGRSDPAKREEWRWISFAHRMEQLYGREEAARRLNEPGERQPPAVVLR